MQKNILLTLSVLTLSLLQACGGGSNDDGDATPAKAPTAKEQATGDIGSVSARLEPNGNTVYMLLARGKQSFGRAETSEPTDSGALVHLGRYLLSDPRQTVDISGDTHYALGRWVNGTVTDTSETYAAEPYTLTGSNTDSYHYLAYKRLTELPADGELQCRTVAVTAPTAFSSPHEDVGLASGYASVSFGANGAAVQGEMEVLVGGESAKVSLSTLIQNTSFTIIGQLFSGGPGAALALADQGSEVPGLVVGYKAQLPDGVLYTGMARLACTSK